MTAGFFHNWFKFRSIPICNWNFTDPTVATSCYTILQILWNKNFHSHKWMTRISSTCHMKEGMHEGVTNTSAREGWPTIVVLIRSNSSGDLTKRKCLVQGTTQLQNTLHKYCFIWCKSNQNLQPLHQVAQLVQTGSLKPSQATNKMLQSNCTIQIVTCWTASMRLLYPTDMTTINDHAFWNLQLWDLFFSKCHGLQHDEGWENHNISSSDKEQRDYCS